MKISVVDEVKSLVGKKVGIPSAGSSATSKALSTMVTAEFPSQRAAGIDNAYNASSLYNNGLLFTAYDFSGGLTPGSKDNLRSLRIAAQNPQQILSAATGNVKFRQVLNTTSFGALSPICQILLPRSVNDNEINSHRYQEATDSFLSKGLSRVLSNMVWGAVDSIGGGGILADRRESLEVGAKSAFQGSDRRTKMYYNTFVIENRNDLVELIKIYYLFTVLGYGTTSTGTPQEVAEKIKNGYNELAAYLTNIISPGSNQSTADAFKGGMVNNAIDYLSNVEVIKSPPVWFIRDFQTGEGIRFPHSTFGPAGITSVRFGRSMDNIVNTLRESPNTPIAVEIEIQFSELIDMRQDSIFDQ
ncbi:baseplate [Yersinia phage JC221]|nr:baseplate [Yersinia phage JC221]